MNEFTVKYLFQSFPLGGGTYGIKDANRKSQTAYSIDLPRMLGSLYDKYDYFKLSLLSVSTMRENLIVPLVSPEDGNLYINVNGLNFINPNGKNGSHKLAIYTYDTTKLTTSYYDDNYIIFAKSNFPNLTIYFTRLIDDAIPTSTYTNFVFYFSITPIDMN